MDKKRSNQTALNQTGANQTKLNQQTDKAKTQRIETITTIDLRQKMGDILNRVFYGMASFRIQRKQRTLAYLVSPEYIERVGEAIAYLHENEPGLVKKLGLQPSDDLRDLAATGDDEA